jgi:hypothetical protein
MSAPARAARRPERAEPQIGDFRGQHMTLAETQIATEVGRSTVTVDEGESPLVWLAHRRGRDGQAMIVPYQLLAGERLRADFTRANMMPRTTSNWESPLSKQRQRPGDAGFITEGTVAARQRVHQALDAVGPEFSGLLLDVCCFLKRLEDVERERLWPVRSAKVVLQLAGPACAPLRLCRRDTGTGAGRGAHMARQGGGVWGGWWVACCTRKQAQR